MKSIRLVFLMGLCLIGPRTALAQFLSGSTGADGPLNVASNVTLNLPPDGIFHFTTITVASSGTLRFNKNALNTPVILLATGNVTISGSIDVSSADVSSSLPGRGGPGGFDGGLAGFPGFGEGDGQGPGGGKNMSNMAPGVYAAPANQNSNVYGNTLLSPLIGGSGGSAVFIRSDARVPGGSGGGAVLIASSTSITVGGQIDANGGGGGGNAGGGGSGGAIRLVAPIVAGSGALNVNGGRGITGENNGGTGRTRVDALDRFAHRSLMMGGKATRGSQMFVFPSGNPRLDILSAAGTAIPEGANTPVTVTLPIGAPQNQIVRVQARGFTTDVPIRVKITPENAPSATFDGVILQSSGNPPFADVEVTLPVDTVCHVHAWTR